MEGFGRTARPVRAFALQAHPVSMTVRPGRIATCVSSSRPAWRCCAYSQNRATRLASLAFCHGPSCSQAGSSGLYEAAALLIETAESGEYKIEVDRCGCLGECSTRGANVGLDVDGEIPIVKKEVAGVEDLAQIILELSRSIKLNEDVVSALAFKESGSIEFGLGKFTSAIALYSDALASLRAVPSSLPRNKVCAAILSNRSVAHARLKMWLCALEDANAAVDSFPGLAAAWKRKAEAEEGLGDTEKTLQSVRVALELESSPERRKSIEKWKRKLEARRRWRLF